MSKLERWLKWINRIALLALLVSFRIAVQDGSVVMQVVFAALIVANAHHHWREP